MAFAESKTLTRDTVDAHLQRDAHSEEVVIMTDRYTNAEWATQIAETQRKIFGQAGEAGWKGNGKKYELEGGVRVGSQELGHLLARSVDHTVLKLDATAAQIDALCSEARTEGFKVCDFFIFSLEFSFGQDFVGCQVGRCGIMFQVISEDLL
jgi:deoxyribose-phosphate aldolase